MTRDQAVILAVLVGAVLLFLWGKWRHDMVAVGALLATVAAGLVAPDAAFAGFGHPAVVTVACVLVLSRGLQESGAVDLVSHKLLPSGAGPVATIAGITALAALLSAFMNNVGALALLMPLAIQLAARHDLPPGKVLMPLAFGSILGGMTTLIGTPPNLIVAGFRAHTRQPGFGMFDYTPVGLAVALSGIAFITLIGWRLVPARTRADAAAFDTGAYLTEARIPEKAKAVGMTLREVDAALDEADAQVVGLVRGGMRIAAPHPGRRLRAADILVIEAEPKSMSAALSSLGLALEEAVPPPEDDEAKPKNGGEGEAAEVSAGGESGLIELAVLPGSMLAGRSATDIRLRSTFSINLLAISRSGQRTLRRLRTEPLRAGDVLLMQGSAEAVAAFAAQYGCVPLAERTLRLPDKRRALTAGAVMAAAVIAAASGLMAPAIAFAGGMLAAMVLRVVSIRRVYDAIDWPVVVLLGALIPVAGAMSSTGAADLIARLLMEQIARGQPVVALVVILVVTMTLSDFMNNAATTAVMCPIAIGAATGLGVSTDPFLMAVAVGASCAFLTPIGHQNNTLILGPGGFRFGDYWKLGLPLEVIVVAVSVPLLLLVWPM
ncbi:MAG: SLC13 family permease [Acetobacteraceae bacterium]|nr:SLC13 family permease [Acetobacteraceae bacterium]